MVAHNLGYDDLACQQCGAALDQSSNSALGNIVVADA
jgi:hypothetical protein